MKFDVDVDVDADADAGFLSTILSSPFISFAPVVPLSLVLHILATFPTDSRFVSPCRGNPLPGLRCVRKPRPSLP